MHEIVINFVGGSGYNILVGKHECEGSLLRIKRYRLNCFCNNEAAATGVIRLLGNSSGDSRLYGTTFPQYFNKFIIPYLPNTYCLSYEIRTRPQREELILMLRKYLSTYVFRVLLQSESNLAGLSNFL